VVTVVSREHLDLLASLVLRVLLVLMDLVVSPARKVTEEKPVLMVAMAVTAATDVMDLLDARARLDATVCPAPTALLDTRASLVTVASLDSRVVRELLVPMGATARLVMLLVMAVMAARA
jgi:hypothetical protein